ncbi:hypothetical protein ACOSP6_05630 [Tenacibaculum sp. MEBiC06402]|uniref:hypothetical protein n=1 Tax=unclassified Tenacibaculum TaxID=2635139 RepID=UPI003B9946BF
MLKSISSLGISLSKDEQASIFAGVTASGMCGNGTTFSIRNAENTGDGGYSQAQSICGSSGVASVVFR